VPDIQCICARILYLLLFFTADYAVIIDVSPSVRLSVCRTTIFCRTAKFILKHLFQEDSYIILVFFCTKRYGNTPTKIPLTRAVNAGGGGHEKIVSLTNISLYLGNDTKQSHSYYGRRIGNGIQAFEWYQFL